MPDPELWAVPSEYNAAAAAWLNNTVDALSRELHPLLASVRRERVADLPRPEEHAPETAELASPLFRGIEVSHVVTADVQDTLAGNVDSFLTMVFDLANAFGSQMVRGILVHIREVCDASGQTTDVGGQDIFDVMIETLDTIDMSFDESGKPNLTLLAAPDVAQKFQGKKPTREQEARVQQILARRRKEWDASRRRHDLP